MENEIDRFHRPLFFYSPKLFRVLLQRCHIFHPPTQRSDVAFLIVERSDCLPFPLHRYVEFLSLGRRNGRQALKISLMTGGAGLRVSVSETNAKLPCVCIYILLCTQFLRAAPPCGPYEAHLGAHRACPPGLLDLPGSQYCLLGPSTASPGPQDAHRMPIGTGRIYEN